MADLLFYTLITLAFVVVSVALAARFGVEALIIWSEYKQGMLDVTRDQQATPSEEDDPY